MISIKIWFVIDTSLIKSQGHLEILATLKDRVSRCRRIAVLVAGGSVRCIICKGHTKIN